MRDLRQLLRAVIAVACAAALLAATGRATAAQAQFASPEEAVAAMVDAVRLNNDALLAVILGPRADALIHSGDPAQDQRRRHLFLQAYEETHSIVAAGDARSTLHVGKDAWPLPIPLVKSQGRWHFDTRAGEREILARRIGRNELAAIEVCRAIADAEREYAARDVDGDGILEYAARIASTPGKRDGLYWNAPPGEPASPLGPFLGAAGGNAGTAALAPYHGYFFRILTAQGKHATGGARNYIVKRRMLGGFAVIAYPARYGASGVMSFIINQEGVVYQKDLGRKGAALARTMSAFDPDATWKRL